MSLATVPMHFEREEPGAHSAAVLAVLVHLILFAVLFFGVHWQSRPPEPVSVELWLPPPPPPVIERVEEKPVPVIAPPAPPRPEPKVEETKPDIAIKSKPEPKLKPKPEPVKPKLEPVKPKPKPEPLPPRPKPKPEAVKPKPEPAKSMPDVRPRVDEMQTRMREELAREQNSLKVDRERLDIKNQLLRDQAAAQKGSLDSYIGKIQSKVKGNWILPIDLKGNPVAVFVVIQLPTGEVLSAQLKKSSGNASFDSAVERAIVKSSPLPKPEKGELFFRELTLTFRPHD